MEALARHAARQTGISEEQARSVIQIVMDYLMTQLPAHVAQQVKAWSGWGDYASVP